MNKLLIAMLLSTTAHAQPQQVTTFNDPMGQLIGTLTNQGYQSIFTDPTGQVSAVITNPTPTYSPSYSPAPNTMPTITSPIAPPITAPQPPALPQISPWGSR
jgi:hypothetical protein